MAKEKVDLSNLINAESSRNKTAIIGMAIVQQLKKLSVDSL